MERIEEGRKLGVGPNCLALNGLARGLDSKVQVCIVIRAGVCSGCEVVTDENSNICQWRVLKDGECPKRGEVT